jgi:hypothetical protein
VPRTRLSGAINIVENGNRNTWRGGGRIVNPRGIATCRITASHVISPQYSENSSVSFRGLFSSRHATPCRWRSMPGLLHRISLLRSARVSTSNTVKRIGSVGNFPNLHSGGGRFESCPNSKLPNRSSSLFTSVHPAKLRDIA